MNKGQNLYKKATQIIPGGNQLLSKRPEMFLPDFWPAYYQKAKGCEVWDLDDNEYSANEKSEFGTGGFKTKIKAVKIQKIAKRPAEILA